ncbi:MAG: hypothetical protein E7509_06445 [Ruminococcus sp.]|nr:hypothetical protein [Ruminococcus sp.]
MKQGISRLKVLLIILGVLFLIGFAGAVYGALFLDDKPEYITIDEEQLTYQINRDWIRTTDTNNGGILYADKTTKGVFFKCALITSGNNLTPELYFQALKMTIADRNAEVYEALSDVKTDANGMGYRSGSIKYSEGKKKLFSYLVFCEEKNLVVLFQAQCDKEENVDDTYKALKKMANSIVFKTLPDAITGNTFEVSSEAGAVTHYIVSYDNKTFKMCEKLENSYTDYLGGTYQVFRGKKAIEKVASMEEYGLTEDEQKTTILNQGNSLEQYYAVVFTIDKNVTDGQEEACDKVTKLYLATADEKGTNLEVFSCDGIKYEKWKLLA